MLIHLPHKEGRGWATEYLEWVYLDIGGRMSVAPAGRREYVYVVTDDYTRAVYTGPLRLESEVVEVFKAFGPTAVSRDLLRFFGGLALIFTSPLALLVPPHRGRLQEGQYARRSVVVASPPGGGGWPEWRSGGNANGPRLTP